MPVIICEIHNDWDKHWECFIFIGLEDVEEVVILEEAHGSVCDLKMNTTNASDDSFEKLWNQVLNLIHFANFKNFLKFGEEKCFLDTVGERPVLQETFEQWDGQCPILG